MFRLRLAVVLKMSLKTENNHIPSIKIPVKETKTSARVLTNLENRLAIEKQEQAKKQMAEEKAKRAEIHALNRKKKVQKWPVSLHVCTGQSLCTIMLYHN